MIRTTRVDDAAAMLTRGLVVALATDTVYGLGASLSHPDAIGALFAMKRRPRDVALPVLVDGVEALEALGVTWPNAARRLSDVFWPGALTIVVEVDAALARLVGATTNTVGFRVPADPGLVDLLARTGPLAVSSANEHAHEPCHSAEDIIREFSHRDDLAGVLDGGVRDGRVSSVVVVERTSWRVIRDGAVSRDDLARILDAPA